MSCLKGAYLSHLKSVFVWPDEVKFASVEESLASRAEIILGEQCRLSCLKRMSVLPEELRMFCLQCVYTSCWKKIGWLVRRERIFSCLMIVVWVAWRE